MTEHERTRTVAQVMSLSSHPHVHVHVSVLPRLALPLLLHALLAALLPFPPALEVRRQPAHSAQKESMDLSDEFFLSTLRGGEVCVL